MLSCKNHPIVRLCDISEMSTSDMTRCFVVILQGRESRVCTGVTSCDFRDATLLFFRPGECKGYVERMKKVNRICKECSDEGFSGEAKGVLALCFCGDWLERTLTHVFGEKCCWQKRYGFFEYNIKESLHLSLREKAVVEKCLCDIKDEMEWGLDDYSNMLIAQKLKMFFDYCCRYYDRQHITRSCLNHRAMAKVEHMVDEYLLSGEYHFCSSSLASASSFATTSSSSLLHRFAELLGMSETFFDDFLRAETGKSVEQYLGFRHFEVAKQLLLSSPAEQSLASIARKLGYSSSQCFIAAFRRVVGCNPSDFRNVN